MPPKRRDPRVPAPETRLRLLRTDDFVDLSVTLYGATLRTVDGVRHVRTDADGGVLVLTLPPQHVQEEAYPESVPLPSPPPVAELRIAEASRLAFDLPPSTSLPLSIEGLLELIPSLPLRTTALAKPAAAPAPGRAIPIEDLIADTDVIAARRAGTVTTVLRAARAARHVRLAARLRGIALTALEPGDQIIVKPGLLRKGQPRVPGEKETAIEAPYRLIVSPSARFGAFRHPSQPVRAPSDPARTQLWHTDLTTRVTDDDGEFLGHDEAPGQRIVRAVWARDLNEHLPGEGFLSSIDPMIRRTVVRQSGSSAEGITPLPLQVNRLSLSSLGAWIDWRGSWAETWNDYPAEPGWFMDLESYTHQAAMGRDSYVRVTQPGFLFPFGHRAVWVTVTERKIDPAGPATAYLRQRYFIVLRERTRTYDGRDTPLRRVTLSPTTTPDLDRPAGIPADAVTVSTVFVPTRAGAPFRWDIDADDAARDPVSLSAPLLFVPSNALDVGVTDQTIRDTYQPVADIPADGAGIALAEPAAQGDTAFEIATLRFDAEIDRAEVRSRPFMTNAEAVVPAMRHLAPASPKVDLSFTQAYLDHGFGAGNPAQLFLGLAGTAPISFSDGSDRSGGFIEPNFAVRGLSRTLGAVGDDGTSPQGLSQGEFDPATFLDGALPKLFGLFSLVEILDALDVDLDNAPAFVTEALDAVTSIASEVERLQDALDGGLTRLAQDLATAAHAGARAQVQAAIDELEAAAAPAVAAITALLDALEDLIGHPESAADVLAKALAVLNALTAVLEAVKHPMLPASVRATIEKPALALQPLLAQTDLLTTIAEFADNLLSPSGSVTARYEWRPAIADWAFPGTSDPVFIADDKRGLSLGVEVRASASGSPSADISAELRQFALQLMPGEPMMRMNFSRIGFRVGTGTKPEVDVVFDGMEFLGVLGFIDKLREIIPFDGFADPPYVDVSTEGVTAGFDLALPNVSVGVFSLENISLGADARVPFLGDAVTVGFYFCRKDSPFRLTVMCIGGGGWVGLRASPKGLVELEMGLEAGASLSINLGVASGSVSITVGVYLRLEGDAGSLTAYFRIRGEVDVLGLISASITLELSLTYDFPTGKLIGRASVIVEVEVLFFSASVEVSCERKLAGSKGDPTLIDIMPPEPDGSSPAWSEYCAAFAGVSA